MRRRNFIAGLGVAAMLPRSARAQFTKTSRIAIVHPDIDERELGIASTHVGYRALFEELKRLGYSEGVNLVVGRYSAHGRTDLNSQLARDIVATAPAVILATNGALVVALVQATTSIPIVGVS